MWCLRNGFAFVALRMACGEARGGNIPSWDHEPRSAGLRPGHIGSFDGPGLETGAPVHGEVVKATLRQAFAWGGESHATANGLEVG